MEVKKSNCVFYKFKSIYFIWTCFILICSPFLSISQYLFQKQFTHSHYAFLTTGFVNDSGSIYLFGDSYNNIQTYRSNQIIKIDKFGNIINASRFAFADSTTMERMHAVENADHTISVSGYTKEFSPDIGYVRLDSSGMVLSAFKLLLPLGDYGRNIISTKDTGNLILGNINYTGLSPDKGAVIKVGKAGNIEWVRQYGANGRTMISSAIEKPNGNFMLFGHSSDFSDTIDFINDDLIVLEINSIGEILQTNIFQSPAPDLGYYIFESDNGGWYFAITTGIYNWAYKQEIILFETDSLLNTLWAKRYWGFSPGVGNDYLAFMVRNMDGSFLFSNGNRVIKLNATGSILWQNSVYYPSLSSFNYALELMDTTYLYLGVSAISVSSIPQSGYIVKVDTSGMATCYQNFNSLIQVSNVSIQFQPHYFVDSLITYNAIYGAFSDTISILDSMVCDGYLSDQFITNEANPIMLFPTIADDQITISFDENKSGTVSIFNARGQKVDPEFGFINASNVSLDVRNHSPGIYFIIINTESNQSSFKIVKL